MISVHRRSKYLLLLLIFVFESSVSARQNDDLITIAALDAAWTKFNNLPFVGQFKSQYSTSPTSLISAADGEWKWTCGKRGTVGIAKQRIVEKSTPEPLEWAYGTNGDYIFELHRSGSKKEWLITRVTPAEDNARNSSSSSGIGLKWTPIFGPRA